MTLSRRALKSFDRRGGADLVLPWPAGLPDARGDLRPDDERAASGREHAAAAGLAAPIATAHGLVHIATRVALIAPPGPSHTALLFLLAHLVTPRWRSQTVPGEMRPLVWSLIPAATAGRTVHIDLTIGADLLAAIDEAAKARGLTRSAFLIHAAREAMERR